ncbi:MAG: NUDIX domain-containing protein [Pseudomonadota bacterium]
MRSPRLAVRAVIVERGKLLLVNAFRDPAKTLWCAPGGGVERGSSLTENLAREIYEETGCYVRIGPLCLVSEFHNPEDRFHQVDLFFRATLSTAPPQGAWTDPTGVVSRRRFFAPDELSDLHMTPPELARIAFDPASTVEVKDLVAMIRP